MINLAQILGRVGKVDTRATNSGSSVTNISMVTTKKYNKNGEKIEKATWHNITCFSKLSEIAQKYVAIGDLLYIQGEIDTQKFTGADNVERTKTFIIAHELKLLPKAKAVNPEPKQERSYEDAFGDPDIPF
jgi:single-strand DNA-binding protein